MKDVWLRTVALLLVLIAAHFKHAECFEFVTTSVGTVVALTTSALFAGYTTFKCFGLEECCDKNSVKLNATGLEAALKNHLHGQHLVTEPVVRLLYRHMNNDNPDKALVLSFHGWTGNGKNFVSKFIADNVFSKGYKSKFVHMFVATLHFPHKHLLNEYKDQLQRWIRGNVSSCDRSMFIFDEMDKMPHGLLDAIKPFLDHHPDIDGVNYRKTIFLFLSNTAGAQINEYALNHWESGQKREAITRKEMEKLINLAAFNEQGGLWHSSLIEKNLITAFIPFLPLEKRHVKLCIHDELKRRGRDVSPDYVNKVIDELTFFPAGKEKYSASGCKRISQKMDLIIELESDD